MFGHFVNRIYPIGFEIKDPTYTDRSASYLDIHIEFDSEERLKTKPYDKRDHFNFPIVNFPFICSNFPAEPIYGVYIYISVDAIFLGKFPGRYHELVDRYGISVSQMTTDLFHLW